MLTQDTIEKLIHLVKETLGDVSRCWDHYFGIYSKTCNTQVSIEGCLDIHRIDELHVDGNSLITRTPVGEHGTPGNNLDGTIGVALLMMPGDPDRVTEEIPMGFYAHSDGSVGVIDETDFLAMLSKFVKEI